jgi:tetratricopeptide (TPR) repeat protein
VRNERLVASSMGEENNLEPGQADPNLSADEPDESAATSGAETSSAAKKGGMTPGQRLAAKKAQKAIQKKDFKAEIVRKEEEARDKEREDAQRIFARPKAEPALPEEMQKVAGDFTDFMQHNRARILGVVAAFVGASALFILGQRFVFTGSAEQASKLGSALELSEAQVDPSDTDGKNDDGEPVFKSRDERLAKSADAFAAVVKQDPKATSAGWASTAEASLKLQQGKFDEAQKLFDAAYSSNKGSVPYLAARALEGSAIALEAAGKSDEAIKRFEELKAFDNGSQKDLAEYHLGRIKLAKGDRDGAKALLKPLYDRLSDHSQANAPANRYLRGEVELRLSEIDSSLVDKGSSMGAGGGDQQFSEEQIQRLIEQLSRQKQQQGGAP